MKEIWINLELYIKSYEFSIFKGFFRIFKTVFLILFSILNNKINKKIKKKGGAGPAWMRRGTQGHVAAPRRPRAAPTWREIYIYMYLLYKYKMGLCPPLYGEGHTYRNGRVLYTRQFL